jgi:hypothetical protein
MTHIVHATIIAIINYDCNTFIVQATGINVTKLFATVGQNKLEWLSLATFLAFSIIFSGKASGLYYKTIMIVNDDRK